jgi:hypothetical protein
MNALEIQGFMEGAPVGVIPGNRRGIHSPGHSAQDDGGFFFRAAFRRGRGTQKGHQSRWTVERRVVALLLGG